jgi:hypothetical protein
MHIPADWSMLLKEGKKLVLVVKCELITDEDDVVAQFKAVAPDIKHVNTASVMLLRAERGWGFVIWSTLQCVPNIGLSDESWDQATLPVANGGLGIQRATDIALPAFLSQTLVDQLLLQKLHGVSGTNEPSFTAPVSQWQSRTNYFSPASVRCITEGLGHADGEDTGS